MANTVNTGSNNKNIEILSLLNDDLTPSLAVLI